LISEHPAAVPIQRITMCILGPPPEIIADIFYRSKLRDAAVKGGQAFEQQGKFGARLAGKYGNKKMSKEPPKG
jgi:hypothetical protein